MSSSCLRIVVHRHRRAAGSMKNNKNRSMVCKSLNHREVRKAMKCCMMKLPSQCRSSNSTTMIGTKSAIDGSKFKLRIRPTSKNT